MNYIEVLASNNKWLLWTNMLEDQFVPEMLYKALEIYDKVRVNNTMIYTKEKA